MNAPLRKALLTLGAGLAFLLALTAHAVEPDLKGVTDPTKPPSGVMLKMLGDRAGRGARSGSGESGAAEAQAAMPAASGASAPAAAASGADSSQPDPWAVSSIRIDLATGDGVALVGDELVKVGDTVHGMKVVAISASEVHLKGPEGIRKLVLPDVIEQSRAKTARAAKRGRKEKR
ncbi:MAG TPA: hypothetical protein VFW93_05375 [Aquabacterium sp.]|uniref:hypothetical protein n=1 Tax=Aquabacterium sp. TaxID=1872578 RepID=UPI002E308295|nr:hypothetical protein [Aquabacterium sp.]HEX5355623.1 hypothetical protein [Aquabacterium sp.]